MNNEIYIYDFQNYNTSHPIKSNFHCILIDNLEVKLLIYYLFLSRHFISTSYVYFQIKIFTWHFLNTSIVILNIQYNIYENTK